MNAMLPLTAHAEGDAADDDCEDRKPAAKPAFVSSHNNKNDEMDGDDDSSSSSNHCRNSNGEQHHVEEGDKPPMVTSSASVAAASAAVATTDEGHRLSNYELQRLERIKRNRQYLEQLGLEGKGKRGVISSSLDHPNPVKHKRTRNNAAPDVARRSSMSRQSKLKSVNYAEPTASVRALMKTGAQNKKKKSLVEAKINTEKKTAAATAEKAKNDRMDQIIYMEFNRIKREKNQLLKTASRNVRLAQKEVKYWTRLESVWERREERRLEHQRQQAAEAMQKACLGGKTTKELLKDLDDKMPTILQAMKNFDDSILSSQLDHEREQKRLDGEYKLKLLHAVDRFPKAMKSAVTLLNAALLESAPSELLPPPRRSKRSAGDESQNESPAPEKKRIKRKLNDLLPPAAKDDCMDEKIKLCPEHEQLHDDDDDEDNTNAASADVGKQRKRVARNVGGWISPDFAKTLDNSWLTVDSPVNKFVLSHYVPQVGDTVLYYISGHQLFLSEYPDVLGKKTRTKSRVPLWERAAKMKGEQQFTDEQAQDSSWWTAHWLEGVKNLNLGDYPLICRVERTQAEFPPDPFCKVIDRETVDGPVISFKSKNHSNASLNSSTQVRLAVTLKPLTPLTVTDNASLSTLPPSFTAVTFPCHLEPFIVPFAWGYTRWHSLSMNQKVTSTQQKNDIFRVDSFCAYENMGTMRLDDKASSVRRILDALEHSKSRNAAIEDKLARYKLDLPLIDALIVIDNWYRCTKPFAGNELVLATPMDFSSLLRQTLPLWKSVAVMKNMYDRNKPRVSPWNLAPVAKTSDFVLPWCIAGRNIQLDNSLRLQLEFMFEEFSTKISSSATMDLFYDPVTEDDAPSYGCAVPVGLATSNIVQRLQINPDVGACYYRSVNAVLTDIASIVDCCLLYNNPESDVVAEASKFVMTLKQKISQIVHDHNNNVSNAYKTDDECCLLLHAPLQSRGSILTSTKNPFKGHVYREWLCYNRPTLGSNNGSSIKISVEALQAGDSVTYSRNLHDRFVQGHLSSLDSYQSRLPSTEVVFGMSPGTPGSSQDDWAQATVVWTMPAFPKVSSKRCEKEDKPFHVNTLLQCLGVRFEKSDEGSGAHDAVVPFKMNSIDCCFSVLKKRCLLQTYPSFVDPSLTKEAVMSGCQPLVTKLGKNSPPSFDQLFTMSSRSSTVVEKHHGTRGIALKPKQDNPDVERLVSAGFLPRWISGIDGGTMDAVVLRKMECILPTPKMSLELIQLRLRNGFYRQKSAVVNDIVDSYLSTVVALLFDELSRKKSSISLKKVALLLATLPDVSGEPHAWHFVEKIDEASCLQQLDAVRTLHACALVSVADTSVAEVMFGVVVSPTHSVFEPPYQDPARISARQKLAYLVASTRRDDCLNAFPGLRDEESVPLVKFSIRLAGELILTEDQLRPLIAVVDSTQVNVIVSCEGTSLGREIHREDMCGHNKVASISFTLEDYMRDDSLAKLLFRRPGRSGPCARCQTFKRSMLACRVIRRHSNVDFDWVSAFSDGLGNLTELLSTLGATDALDVSKVDHYDVPVVDNIVKSDKFIEENELTRSDCDYSSINARELVKKAVSALKHADDVLNESAAFSERPIRLSKEFIQRAFPVDPSDGHYLYCVVCGISGDLLCCDGCPNVVHCKCVSLSKLPEGDWFCEECVSSRNPDQPEEPNHMCKQEVTTTTRSGDTTARINNSESRLTLGCESDVSNKTEYVELLLDELRRSRPDQKLKTSADRHAVDGDDEDDDESVKLDEALYPFFGGRQSEPGVSLCSDVLTVTESKDGKGNSWRATRNDGSVYSQGKADVIKGNLIDPGAENLLTQSSGLCAVNERWKSEILSVCSHDSTRRLPSPRKRTPPVRFVNCIDS